VVAGKTPPDCKQRHLWLGKEQKKVGHVTIKNGERKVSVPRTRKKTQKKVKKKDAKEGRGRPQKWGRTRKNGQRNGRRHEKKVW